MIEHFSILNNASQPTASTRDVYYIGTIETLSIALVFYVFISVFVCVLLHLYVPMCHARFCVEICINNSFDNISHLLIYIFLIFHYVCYEQCVQHYSW